MQRCGRHRVGGEYRDVIVRSEKRIYVFRGKATTDPASQCNITEDE